MIKRIKRLNESGDRQWELISTLRNNAEAIIDDVEIMYNNGGNMDDTNYRILRKAAKAIMNVRADVAQVRINTETWATNESRKRSNGRKLKESNEFADEPIVMYYRGKKIYEGDSDTIYTYRVLRDLMERDNDFYLDAKDFLENELGIESSDVEDCADGLAEVIFYDSTYADSIESFYVPFGNFEAFFKSDEAV